MSAPHTNPSGVTLYELPSYSAIRLFTRVKFVRAQLVYFTFESFGNTYAVI